MDITETIKEFLSLVLDDESELDEPNLLIAALDKLAYSIIHINYVFDETDFPESPEQNYQLIRKKVQKRFPTLGYYNVAQDISDNLEKSIVVVGDAIDDISDIVVDLSEVMWCFENTSENDALWHYQNSYKTHWGKHLRELQLYLHDKLW